MADMSKFTFTLRGGYKMPALGLGTNAPKDTDEEVMKAVHTAVKAGYRHLDCAAMYRNERTIGQTIKLLIVEGTTREDLFVSSKLWNTCHRPDLVRTSLKKSLEDLGLKYLDLYLMHWPMAYKEGGEFVPTDNNEKVIPSDVDYVDTWKALEDCVDEGLVRNIGLSNFSSRQVQRILETARIKPACNQVELHLHLSNSRLVSYCQDNNVIITAYSPLGSPGRKSEPPPTCLEEPVLLDIAKQKNKTPAQVFDFELTSEEMEQLYSLNKDHRLNIEQIAVDHKYYTFNDPF